MYTRNIWLSFNHPNQSILAVWYYVFIHLFKCVGIPRQECKIENVPQLYNNDDNYDNFVYL